MQKVLIDELLSRLKCGEMSVAELKSQTVTKIREENKKLNAFITIDETTPLEFDETRMLSGVPIAVKDNICTREIATTCASKMLKKFVPCYDAHAVACLKAAGAVIVGKTNMDEFGMGATGENSAFGRVINPAVDGCVPGGSSSGSAAAVAAGLVSVALGSDTGGSVRQPASHCGVVGFKPSYGAVSRFGLVAFASSMDQIGVLANSVGDVSKVFDVIRGEDLKDQTSCDMAQKYENKPLDKLKIGVCRKYNSAADDYVQRTVEKSINTLEKNCVQIVEINLPMTDFLLPIYYILSSAEASSNLSRFDGIKYGLGGDNCESVDSLIASARCAGFGDEVKRRILLGTFVLSEGYYDNYYLRAQRARKTLSKAYEEILRSECDLILSPTAKTSAPEFGDLIRSPISMYEGDYYTVAANLTGMPAISLPAAGGDMAPVGIQLMSARGSDNWLLHIAQEVECVLKGGAKL